jgi:hypothetical protein
LAGRHERIKYGVPLSSFGFEAGDLAPYALDNGCLSFTVPFPQLIWMIFR